MIRLAWITTRDLPEMERIERASFDSPWTAREIAWFMSRRNCTGRLAFIGNDLAGFILYRFATRHMRIETVAVEPTFRRQGVASALVGEIRKKLYEQRPRMSTMVRETNLPAQLFFRSQGFTCVYTERNPYDVGEDGYVFQYRLPAPELVCFGR
jgi:ribosomal-protein-alanine N-acetyltransferase